MKEEGCLLRSGVNTADREPRIQRVYGPLLINYIAYLPAILIGEFLPGNCGCSLLLKRGLLFGRDLKFKLNVGQTLRVDVVLRERGLRFVFFVDSAEPVRRVDRYHTRYLLDLLAVGLGHRIGN